jgi:hypothetical protein
VLADQFRRTLLLAVALLLYYILAFWYPIYWMNSAVNYCDFTCNNYPPISGGCYESTDPQCDDVCEQACDVCEDTKACKNALDLAYESAYATEDKSLRLAAWSLIVVGFTLGIPGVIIAVLATQGKVLKAPAAKTVSGVLVVLASVLVILGAIVFFGGWDKDAIASTVEDVWTATQLLVVVEWMLPATLGIMMGVDLFNLLLNPEKRRMLCLTIPWAVYGLLAGGLWAYIVNWEDWDNYVLPGDDYWLKHSGGCAAAGYFIVGLMAVARILVFGGYVELNPVQAPMIKFAVCILYVIGGFILAVGYWAVVAALFNCESVISTAGIVEYCYGAGSIIYMNADSNAAVSMMRDPLNGYDYDLPYEAQLKSYYVGYTFFILLMTAINAYDMGIVELYKGVRTAQQAASAAS